MKIYLDHAHNAFSPGAVVEGRKEWLDNQLFSKSFYKSLSIFGCFDILLPSCEKLSPTQRLKEAFDGGVDSIFVIHRGYSLGDDMARGCEVILPPFAGSQVQYEAFLLLDSLCTSSGFKNRGVHLHTNTCPHKSLGYTRLERTFLFKVGFIDNARDNSIFDNSLCDMTQCLAQCVKTIWIGGENK